MTEQKTIHAGIIGAAGYTGGELIRILLNHPFATIGFAQSRSAAGTAFSQVHPDLYGETDQAFVAEMHPDVDVIFLCSGHGEAQRFLQEHTVPETVKIIDLSQDFRLHQHARQGNREFVYGLPELNKEAIINATNIANPGCFATAIQLGLLPLAKAGLLSSIYTTGITGSTGAGQGLSTTSHFSWRSNNIQSYKTLSHQHLAEIKQSILALNAANKPDLNFVPWRGDFARGIYVSSVMDCSLSIAELTAWFNDFYKNAVFTKISDRMIDMKQVVNTNKCLIHLEKVEGKLAIHSTIDNLLKGASGQAVQNMNLLFGLVETTGLQLKASAF